MCENVHVITHSCANCTREAHCGTTFKRATRRCSRTPRLCPTPYILIPWPCPVARVNLVTQRLPLWMYRLRSWRIWADRLCTTRACGRKASQARCRNCTPRMRGEESDSGIHRSGHRQTCAGARCVAGSAAHKIPLASTVWWEQLTRCAPELGRALSAKMQQSYAPGAVRRKDRRMIS